MGEKSAQGKDGKAVSLLNLLFSHRPICRGTAGLSQPRSRVLKRRNDQGRVSLINISLQLRFDCVSKLPVAHHLMNKIENMIPVFHDEVKKVHLFSHF